MVALEEVLMSHQSLVDSLRRFIAWLRPLPSPAHVTPAPALPSLAGPAPVADDGDVDLPSAPAEERCEPHGDGGGERVPDEQPASARHSEAEEAPVTAALSPVAAGSTSVRPARRVPRSRVINGSDAFCGALVGLYNGRAFSVAIERGNAWHQLNQRLIVATGRDFELNLGPSVVARNNASVQSGYWVYLYRDRQAFLKATRGVIEFKEWAIPPIEFPPGEVPPLPPLRGLRQWCAPEAAGSSEAPASIGSIALLSNEGRERRAVNETSNDPNVASTDAVLSAIEPAGQPRRGPRFKVGARVRLVNRPDSVGRVVEPPIPTETGYDYVVMLQETGREATYAEAALELAETPTMPVLTRDEFLRELLLFKVDGQFSELLYSFPASRTLFRVYQYKPVLKFLRSPDHRLLIADEVGLGKTIEAGIIYLELKARLRRMRTLVVCPSSLREKWRLELLSRFDEDFTILDSNGLRRLLQQYEKSGDATPIQAIVSLDLLKRYRDDIEEQGIHFDLVIVDEAHHLRNENTKLYDLGETLSAQSDAMIFLTATPLHLGNPDLFNLLQLLRPSEYTHPWLFEQQIEPNRYINEAAKLFRQGDLRKALEVIRLVEGLSLGHQFADNPFYQEIVEMLRRSNLSKRDIVKVQRRFLDLNVLAHVFTRTRKREIEEDAVIREVKTIAVRFSPAEREFYDRLTNQGRRLNQYDERWSSSMRLIMRERQAASCLPAVVQALRKASRDGMFDLEIEGGAILIDDEMVIRSNLDPTELQELRELLRIANKIGQTDTKFD